jgi:hypothetical protein
LGFAAANLFLEVGLTGLKLSLLKWPCEVLNTELWLWLWLAFDILDLYMSDEGERGPDVLAVGDKN